MQDVVAVPVFANGEIWSVDDWLRCRSVCGAQHYMLGRGLIARPDLALQIAATRDGHAYTAMSWEEVFPLVQYFWQAVRRKLPTNFAPGRLKQWLCWLTRSYPEAATLFAEVRQLSDCTLIDTRLGLPALAADLALLRQSETA